MMTDQLHNLQTDISEQERSKIQEARRLAAEEKKKTENSQSNAKAAGLKSTFIVSDDELLMTSFGRGNEAVPEKKIRENRVENVSGESKLTVRPTGEGSHYAVKGRVVQNATADNPLWIRNESGTALMSSQDTICCRRQLEKAFFGRGFDDNIHIQAIYNILDIDKLLTSHVNNVLYEVVNMLRKDGLDYNDFMGYLNMSYTYEQFTARAEKGDNAKAKETYELFDELMRQPQLGYFGDLLTGHHPIKKKDKDDDKLTEEQKKAKEEEEKKKREAELAVQKEKSYYYLCLIAMLRQSLAHGVMGNIAHIYNFDQKKAAYRRASELLDELYCTRIDKLNRDFLKNSKIDIGVLYGIFDVKTNQQKEALVRRYYDFVVRKEYKNQGYSVKKLREIFVEKYIPSVTDKRYDSVRNKLNRFFDLIIHSYYMDHPRELDAFVEKLRGCMKETDKEECYLQIAEGLWPKISGRVRDGLLRRMSGMNYNSKTAHKEYVSDRVLDNVRIPNNASGFSKLVYLLTNLLDGKEINILLTTLINKFENIDSFNCVIRSLGIYCPYKDDFAIFEKSGEIARELRTINSFARMSKEEENTAFPMYKEALQVLGIREDISDEELSTQIEDIMERAKNDPNYGYRNFIINNVIQSNRFKYLVRYNNPARVRKMAGNHAVVNFVLHEISQDQILRYYNSCFPKKETVYREGMCDALADMICGISSDQFSDIVKANSKTKTPSDNLKAERYKAIVRLYLTVMYELTKNLVYINSRYYLAFHCVERDALLYDSERFKEYGQKNKDYIRFVREFLADRDEADKQAKEGNVPGDGLRRRKKNRKWAEKINTDLENSDVWATASFRNCVEHLNAVRNASEYIADLRQFNSYYDIYHYIVQRSLIDQYAWDSKKKDFPADTVNNGILKGYMDKTVRYGGYCKDWVKALCIPFAYNLPRFKNLTVEGLFDMNRPGNTEETEE